MECFRFDFKINLRLLEEEEVEKQSAVASQLWLCRDIQESVKNHGLLGLQQRMHLLNFGIEKDSKCKF